MGTSAAATTIKEGDSALDSAAELGDTILELQDAHLEQDSAKSAAGFLRCIIKSIEKIPTPWNPATGASEALDAGIEAVDGSRGMGSMNTDATSQSDIDYILSGAAERN